MLHSVEFNAATQSATYRNRIVHTSRYLAERAAQRPLFPRSVEVMSARGFTAYVLRTLLELLYDRLLRLVKLRTAVRTPGDFVGTANTSVVFHAGRLMALCESDRPYEIALPSLHTVGQVDALSTALPVTAHPKID